MEINPDKVKFSPSARPYADKTDLVSEIVAQPSERAAAVAREILSPYLSQQCALWRKGESCAACGSRLDTAATMIGRALKAELEEVGREIRAAVEAQMNVISAPATNYQKGLVEGLRSAYRAIDNYFKGVTK